MKKKKKAPQNSRVITKDAIISMLVGAIAILNLLTLAFAVIDAKIVFLSEEVDKHFANGFTLAFGSCPMIIESYENLFAFVCICHFIAALLIILLVALRLALGKAAKLGRLGTVSVIISSFFTTLYFVLGCVAYAKSEAYRNMGYDVNTFAFIPFVLMIILAASFILVKVKLPKNYKITIKK